MKTVGVYEAKAKLSYLLDEVERGECIVITRHGKPVATLRATEASGTDREFAKVAQEFKALRASQKPLTVPIKSLIEEGRRF